MLARHLLSTAAAATLTVMLAVPPVLAAWDVTHWGMTPDQALSALDGATKHAPTMTGDYTYDGVRYYPLVTQQREIETIAGQVVLLFDADDSLQFVVFTPDSVADCDKLEEALIARHGATEALGFGSTAIYNWEADGDIVRFTNSVDAGFCSLNYSGS